MEVIGDEMECGITIPRMDIAGQPDPLVYLTNFSRGKIRWDMPLYDG